MCSSKFVNPMLDYDANGHLWLARLTLACSVDSMWRRYLYQLLFSLFVSLSHTHSSATNTQAKTTVTKPVRRETILPASSSTFFSHFFFFGQYISFVFFFLLREEELSFIIIIDLTNVAISASMHALQIKALLLTTLLFPFHTANPFSHKH